MKTKVDYKKVYKKIRRKLNIKLRDSKESGQCAFLFVEDIREMMTEIRKQCTKPQKKKEKK